MKKIIVIFMIFSILISFTGCEIIKEILFGNEPTPDIDSGEQSGEHETKPDGEPEDNKGDENNTQIPDEHTHSFESTFNSKGHFYECSCGEKREEGHTFLWVTDIEPTYTTPGVKHKECDTCGYKTEENTVADRLIYDEVITEGLVDPSMYSQKSFTNYSALFDFYVNNQEKLNGGFLLLDLSSANESGIHVMTYGTPPAYTFDYEEEKDEKYTNSRLFTYFELYSEELGTDTDINYDVPYHSVTFYLVSNECSEEITDLTFGFYRYSNSKTKWNYLVKIYNQNNVCVGEMYYCTKLDISREWIASFINKYVVVLNKTYDSFILR